MSVNTNKKKSPLNFNSNKMGRSKIYGEKFTVCDGLYGNLKMMYAATSLVGCVVQIQVQSGAVFEGVLRTFSHQFDVVLEMAHKVNLHTLPVKGINPAVQNLISSFPFDGGVFDKLVFKHCDIILLKACNVDVDYAVKDNFTDKAISKFDGQIKERELEPYVWEGADSDSENTSLIIADENVTNGWDVNDMFHTNAKKYGVKSSYDDTLPEYTVPLKKKDTEEYKLQEAKAIKIAHEIEASNSYQSNLLLENEDEEDRYSAVVRPPENSISSKYILAPKRCNLPGLKKQSSSPACIASCMPYSSLYMPDNESKQYPLSEGSQSFPNPCSPYVPNPVMSCIPPTPKDRLLKIPTGGSILEKVPPTLGSSNVKTLPVLSGLPEMQMVCPQHLLPPRMLSNHESRNFSRLKGETDGMEEPRKFSSCHELTIENKQLNELEEEHEHSDVKSDQVDLIHSVERLKVNNDDKSANILKYSTLNPNAKEFVFNPNAKSFIPHSLSVVNSQTSVPVQSQSPVMPIPQTQILQQSIFAAMAPQYVMQATSVSVAMTASFVTTSPLSQASRFHKALPSQPPMQMQYSSPEVLHASAPPQQAIRYPQVNFVVGPPVVSQQPMGLAAADNAVSYCETSHVPAHVIMSTHPGVPLSATSPHSHQQRPQQSQTSILHPSFSPVHQISVPHSQTPTPPSLMYTGSTFGHHCFEAIGSHSQKHSGFSSGSHPMILMQQPVPTSLHSHHSIHMHTQNPGCHVGTTVHLVPQMTNASISTPSFVQHP